MDSEDVDYLVSEYRRLLREGENSTGLDEEEIPKQLEEIREKYQRITGKELDIS